METDAKKIWEHYCEKELAGASTILKELGIVLEPVQPHIRGERYLMSGKKLVLVGQYGGKRVILKLSSDQRGISEIEKEHEVTQTLQKLKFAYYILFSPQEILYAHKKGYAILVTEYIAQDKNFLARPLEEQFFLTLRALKSQEGVHATTSSHKQVVRRAFGMWDADAYLRSFVLLRETVLQYCREDAHTSKALLGAQSFMEANLETIEQYCGFLTHTDFVPHNLRIKDDAIYLIDHTSLHFGNKYEGWARFLNFMLLYNPPLHDLLLQYVKDNRSKEEYLSLRLMQAYKLVFLLAFYAQSLNKTSGDLHTLSQKRIVFWSAVLESVLADVPLTQNVVGKYIASRDALRSTEENQRQQELH